MLTRIRRVSIIILILSTFTCFCFAQTHSLKPQWNEYKSDHFIVHYHPDIPNKYIREFTRKCERYYCLLTERLGLRRFDYWTWEDRARIFIYESRQEYTEGRGRPEWSMASVRIRKKFIDTFYFEEGFFDIVLPHELTHIILREIIGSKTKVPLWFEEGVACANENDCYVKYLLLVKGFLDEEAYIPIPEIEKMDKLSAESQAIFYPIAASVVIFLLEDYKKEHFVQLCRKLRDGNTFYKTMDKIYGIKDAEDLDEKFLSFLRNKSYRDIAAHQSSGVHW